MKKIWIKSATKQDFEEIDIADWIEGVGTVATYYERDFIRRFGECLTERETDESD